MNSVSSTGGGGGNSISGGISVGSTSVGSATAPVGVLTGLGGGGSSHSSVGGGGGAGIAAAAPGGGGVIGLNPGGIVGSSGGTGPVGSGGGGGSGNANNAGMMEELMPLVKQLTNPDQVSTNLKTKTKQQRPY